MSRPTVALFYEKYKVLIWLLIVIAQQAFFLLTTNGTGDDGDSISHYYYNRYALRYPDFFIHHWAKPVFVTLSFLFAQFGFFGQKIFNTIVVIVAAYLSYRLAKALKIKHPELAIPILMLMPYYVQESLSGLTEPLFSLLAVLAVLLLVKKKNIAAAILLSFLPFSRPEGLFFIALGGVYFIITARQGWKYLPLLTTGHIFYSLLGAIVFEKDWLWVFTENPNAALAPTYNQVGEWIHYIKGILSITNIPMYILFWLGCLVTGYRIFQEKLHAHLSIARLLVLTGIFTVIGAHTIFWKFGLFKSFGLIRNILTVAPLMAVIVLTGINFITVWIKPPRWKTFAYTIILGTLIGYNFSASKYTYRYPEDFNLSPLQVLAEEVSVYLKTEFPNSVYYYYYPYFSMALGIDHFDDEYHKHLDAAIQHQSIPPDAVVIWDDWYAPMDGKVPLSMLEDHPDLRFLKAFSTTGKDGKERQFVLFSGRRQPGH